MEEAFCVPGVVERFDLDHMVLQLRMSFDFI